ncbi:MAG: glycosyltransferase family 2 protein [Sarcina sp.]
MKVSVIIPMYNTENFIKECIESVLKQSYKDFEIIIVDDGSTDNSKKYIQEFIEEIDFIKYVYQKNAGLSAARNTGIINSEGEFIVFIDSDDFVDEDFIGELVTLIEQENADIAQCGYYRYDQEIVETMQLHREILYIEGNETFIKIFYKTFIEKKFGMICCNKIYRRAELMKNKILFEKNSEIYAEDLLFNLKVLLNSKKIVISDKVLYYYRVRLGSITQSYKQDLGIRYAELVNRITEYSTLELSQKNNIFKDLLDLEAMNVIAINSYEKDKKLSNIANEIRAYSEKRNDKKNFYGLKNIHTKNFGRKSFNTIFSFIKKDNIWLISICFKIKILMRRVKR